jgi:hypothetical protein
VLEYNLVQKQRWAPWRYNPESSKEPPRKLKRRSPECPMTRLSASMIGRPSLSIIARKLQSEAAARGMTDAQHDALMASLKNDRVMRSRKVRQ